LSGRTKGLPEHVGIIMDGNGRWARRRALPRTFGHQEGVKALKRAVRYAAQRGISSSPSTLSVRKTGTGPGKRWSSSWV